MQLFQGIDNMGPRRRLVLIIKTVWAYIFGGDVVYYYSGSDSKIRIKIAKYVWNPFKPNPLLQIRFDGKKLTLESNQKVSNAGREHFYDKWMYASKSKRVEHSLKHSE